MPTAENHPQTPARGLVLSDLHLFAERSDGQRLFEALHLRLKTTRVLVLNGDIFDFRWSTYADHLETQSAALDWLRRCLSKYPDCQVHFVLGNHDCHESLSDALPNLTTESDRFQWHDHSLQLGSALFIHGDCAHSMMDVDQFRNYREGWKKDRQRGSLVAAFYEELDRFGLTSLAHAWHFPRGKTVHRLVYHLDQATPGWRDRTRHCYFGHTHRPIDNFEHEGIRFHNTGSGITGMGFTPLSFELPAPA